VTLALKPFPFGRKERKDKKRSDCAVGGDDDDGTIL